MHPLLRQFLRSKVDLHSLDTNTWIDRLVAHLTSEQDWDDAFSVIEQASRPDLFARLIEAALLPMLRQGRVVTVRRWLGSALAMGPTSPQIDLGLAEVAFREGRHLDAQMHALDAASGLSPDNPLHSRSLYRAAQSAQLADRAQEALALHQACDAAKTSG